MRSNRSRTCLFFVEKTFTNGPRSTKFVTAFSLESFLETFGWMLQSSSRQVEPRPEGTLFFFRLHVLWVGGLEHPIKMPARQVSRSSYLSGEHLSQYRLGTKKYNSLEEGKEINQLSLCDVDGEYGLSLLYHIPLLDRGARHNRLRGTKLEDEPQVLLKSLTTLLHKLTTLNVSRVGGANSHMIWSHDRWGWFNNIIITSSGRKTLAQLHVYTSYMHVLYLPSNSFLWRKVEVVSIWEIFLDLIMELSELGVPSIHIPFLCLYTNEYLLTIKIIW